MLSAGAHVAVPPPPEEAPPPPRTRASSSGVPLPPTPANSEAARPSAARSMHTCVDYPTIRAYPLPLHHPPSCVWLRVAKGGEAWLPAVPWRVVPRMPCLGSGHVPPLCVGGLCNPAIMPAQPSRCCSRGVSRLPFCKPRATVSGCARVLSPGCWWRFVAWKGGGVVGCALGRE